MDKSNIELNKVKESLKKWTDKFPGKTADEIASDISDNEKLLETQKQLLDEKAKSADSEVLKTAIKNLGILQTRLKNANASLNSWTKAFREGEEDKTPEQVKVLLNDAKAWEKMFPKQTASQVSARLASVSSKLKLWTDEFPGKEASDIKTALGSVKKTDKDSKDTTKKTPDQLTIETQKLEITNLTTKNKLLQKQIDNSKTKVEGYDKMEKDRDAYYNSSVETLKKLKENNEEAIKETVKWINSYYGVVGLPAITEKDYKTEETETNKEDKKTDADGTKKNIDIENIGTGDKFNQEESIEESEFNLYGIIIEEVGLLLEERNQKDEEEQESFNIKIRQLIDKYKEEFELQASIEQIV